MYTIREASRPRCLQLYVVVGRRYEREQEQPLSARNSSLCCPQMCEVSTCGWGQVSDSLVFGGQHEAGTSNFISESYPTHIWQIILVLYWSEREGRWVLNRLVGGSLQGRWAIIQSRVHKSIISTTWSKIRQQHRSSSYLPLAIPEVVWWIFIYLFLH